MVQNCDGFCVKGSTRLCGRELKAALKENKMLTQKLSSTKLQLVSQIEPSDRICNNYTGFTKNERLLIVFENVILYDNQDSSNLKGRRRALAPYESFLMIVTRLWRNFSTKHLVIHLSHGLISSLWDSALSAFGLLTNKIGNQCHNLWKWNFRIVVSLIV